MRLSFKMKGKIMANRESSKEIAFLLELSIKDESYGFRSSIAKELERARGQLVSIEESISTISSIKSDCDKTDYILAASAGVLSGFLDIFLVKKPNESLLTDITDKWFAEKTIAFAKLLGWKNTKGDILSSAIRFLEKKFKVPYDQTGRGESAGKIFELSPSNHHFKSLAHNPSLLGLFFSVVDQFTNSSHFVSKGELIELVDADEGFELKGSDTPSKLFCALSNWLGHLISDTSGSSGSKGRGMGIPSPLLTWTNDIIVLKRKFGIEPNRFDRKAAELAMETYKNGFDIRFMTAQAIPVFINEMFVRLIYSIRRLVKYFAQTSVEEYSLPQILKASNPFTNLTVRRMINVAHGAFCLVDISDATIKGFIKGKGSFSSIDFLLHLNIVGVGRFTVSIYGEIKRGFLHFKNKRLINDAAKELTLLNNYVEGLKILSETYKNESLLSFVSDLENSDMYTLAFDKSSRLAALRNTDEGKILKSKNDIDLYFLGEDVYEEG